MPVDCRWVATLDEQTGHALLELYDDARRCVSRKALQRADIPLHEPGKVFSNNFSLDFESLCGGLVQSNAPTSGGNLMLQS